MEIDMSVENITPYFHEQFLSINFAFLAQKKNKEAIIFKSKRGDSPWRSAIISPLMSARAVFQSNFSSKHVSYFAIS